MSEAHTMSDAEFEQFLDGDASRGQAIFNMRTQNCSKRAQAILADTPYKAKLGKAHISSYICEGYAHNERVRAKLDNVMASLGIQVIA